MKIDFDLRLISQIFMMLVLGTVVILMFVGILNLNERQKVTRNDHIEEIIDNALVQCYALEGSYPSDLYYLENYGVIFNEDKYVYYFEVYGANIIPEVTVISK